MFKKIVAAFLFMVVILSHSALQGEDLLSGEGGGPDGASQSRLVKNTILDGVEHQSDDKSQSVKTSPQTESAAISVYSFIQNGRMHADKTGTYGEVMKRIAKRIDTKIIVKPNYLARGLRNFDQSQNGCFFPIGARGFEILFAKGKYHAGNRLYSMPVDLVKGHVFSRKGKPLIRSVEDMRDKKFAVMRRIAIQEYFPSLKDHNFIKTPSDDYNIRLMLNGRVDYVISFMPDAALNFEMAGFRDYTYDPKFQYFTTTTHLGCKKTPETAKLMAEFDRELSKMIQSGELKMILSPYAEVAPVGHKPYTYMKMKNQTWTHRNKQ